MSDARLLAGEDEEALVCVLIAKLAVERLRSKTYHNSHGHLSPSGRQLHAAYEYAAARLLQLGVYDQRAYDEDCEFVQGTISEIGYRLQLRRC